MELMRFICTTQPYSTCRVHLCHTALFNLQGTLLPHTLIKFLGCTCAAHCCLIYRLHLCHIAVFNLQGVLVPHTLMQLTGSTYATHTLLSNSFRPPHDNCVFHSHLCAGGQYISGYFLVNLMIFYELLSYSYDIKWEDDYV